jgi:hypothetical protein
VSDDRFARIETLYHAARALPPEERARYLAHVAADEDMRREVESMLAQHGAGVITSVKVGARPALAKGTMIGNCRIIEQIGAGGMGDVYRARDSKLGRDVAIKILRAHLTHDAERRARFAREARVLGTLNHPHIGAIYGLEETDGVTGLVLELVDGPSLATRLRRGPIKIRETLTISRQIAEALDAAHEKGIVHRDLKPANIVLQEASGSAGGPRAKVLDFGLAKPLFGVLSDGLPGSSSDAIEGTDEGRVLGTPAYMSPEQARGQPVDKRTDIWAFGCVCFEMLTGRSPFAGQTVSETVARILEREPEWTLLPSDTPPAVQTLLRRCLRKDPDRRLRDIGDARLELDDQHQMVGPVSARRRVPLAWVVVPLLLASALAVTLFTLGRQRPPVPSPLQATIEPPQNTSYWYRTGPVALSPDGRYLAAAVSTGNEAQLERTQLWIRPLGSNDWRAVPGTEGARTPFWKADSQEVGFFAEGKLKAVPARIGGIAYDICDAPEGYSYYAGGAWSQDDVIIFMSSSFTLQRVSARGGIAPTPLTLLQPGQTSHRWPSFLPDGQHYLYLALGPQGEPGVLYVGSLDGTAPVSLGPSESNALYSNGRLVSVKNGQLVATPFDVATRRTSGDPAAMTSVDTIEAHLGLGRFADFSAASSGVISYRASAPERLQRLTWRDRRGKAVETVGNPAAFFNLDLSPDGSKLAVSTRTRLSASDIWIFDLRTGNSIPLTTDRAQEYDPRWSPDGNWISFESDRTPGRWSAFRRRADGSGVDEPVIPADSSVYPTSWTPRGMLYAQNEDLFVFPLDGRRKPLGLRRTEGRKSTVVLSPNGHWIAYISQKSGRREIYVRAFPDGEVEYKVSRDGGVAPRWSVAGDEIYFLAPDAALMAARVETVPHFRSAPPEFLFASGLRELPNQFPYAVAQDGRFLIPMPVDPRGAAPVTVLLNWGLSAPGETLRR